MGISNRPPLKWVVFVFILFVGALAIAVAPNSAAGGDSQYLHADVIPVGSTDATVAATHAAVLQDPAYEGGRGACRRCHLRLYRTWERTPHADAYEVLPEESRADPACVKCHVTGYGQPGGFTSIEDTPQLAGGGCEVTGSVVALLTRGGGRSSNMAGGAMLGGGGALGTGAPARGCGCGPPGK